MRKILFALIMVLLLIFTGIIIANGFNIGNLEIWGVKQIVDENDEIDTENAELSTLVSTTYPNSVKKLEDTSKTMQKTKTEYESKAILITDSDYYLQTEEYEIEFLWTKIGNYAKDNDVEIKIEVTSNQLEGRYDLNFTVNGAYSDVTQFIYDIENDSKLGFKIEDFKMSSSSDGVQGTFSCKEIKIDIPSASTTTTTQESNEMTEDNGNTTNTNNATNNTTTNTTSNTTTNTTTNTSTSSDTSTDALDAMDMMVE